MSEEGIAAQFTLIKAWPARCEPLCIARAISSFPVPVSPVMSTFLGSMVSDARSRLILLIRPTVRGITHESRLFLVVARLPGAARSQSTIGVQKMAPQIRVGVHVCRKPIVAIVSVETDESIEIPLSLLYSISARI
jgi:hypothetical protein